MKVVNIIIIIITNPDKKTKKEPKIKPLKFSSLKNFSFLPYLNPSLNIIPINTTIVIAIKNLVIYKYLNKICIHQVIIGFLYFCEPGAPQLAVGFYINIYISISSILIGTSNSP